MTRVLITNDDGFDAEGLRQLVRRVMTWAEVVVVAPDRQQSGMGHAITLSRPLRMRRVEESSAATWYAVEGTPTDCVNLALHSVMAQAAPELILSGINHGLNLGDDVTYSGTVGAALEGHLFGIPSIALSQQMADPESGSSGQVDFGATAVRAADLVRGLLAQGVAEDLLLNINFPIGDPSEVMVTRLGRRVYREVVVEKTDPRGGLYYWLAGTPDFEAGPGTDYEAIGQGSISVTPMMVDLTHPEQIDPLRRTLKRMAEVVAGSES